METQFRDKFTLLWQQYFGSAQLPITFFYDDHCHGVKSAVRPPVHRCLIAQLARVRRGESLCFSADSFTCNGCKRYLGYARTINDRFAYFLSDGSDGLHCERYKQSPALAANFIDNLAYLPSLKHIIFKRWDALEPGDNPAVVIFFATPDTLSGLMTLATFDNNAPDTVITPFGAGCTSIVYHPYMEHIAGRDRAVLGMFDPSARKCVKPNMLTLAIPIRFFRRMVENMESSFLTTHSWDLIQSRNVKV